MTRSAAGSRPDAFATLRPSGLAGVLWGTALLARGRRLFELVEQRDPSRGEQDAILILGIRHLGQGVVQLLAPRHLGSLYAAIDGIHAASMVALAAKEPGRRRATLVSGAIAATSGLLAARSARAQRSARA